MVSNGRQPLDATNANNEPKGKGARRRREPYSWLGVGALSLGVGAAALTTGTGLAYADDAGAAAGSSSQSDSTAAANTHGNKASATGKARTTTNRATQTVDRPRTSDATKIEKTRNRPPTRDAGESEPAAAIKVSAPTVDLPTASASITLPAASGGNSTAPVQVTKAPAVRALPATFAAVSAETKPQLPSVIQLPQQLLAPIQAVFKLLGGLPASPATPELSPVLSLLWGAFRRTETSQPTARASALATTSTPQSAATAVGPSASYSVTNDWGSGHTAAVAVKAGDTAINGWTVEFDSPAQITNIWNGQITSHVGTHYVISNMSYNAKVSAGQSTSFGYQASGGGAAGTPTNVKVNGVASGTPVTPPTVSIADATVAEGNSGTSNASFTVTLSKAATTPVTVGYATSSGTATSGTDFTAASGTLTFAPGVTSQTITVKVTGDTTVESNETFNVALSSPSGATIARGTAVGTITNDDVAPAPTISIANASVAEGNSGTSNASFTVTLSNASTTPVTVGYSTSNGTATAGADFTAASGTLTFAPGTTSQTITVKVTGDTTVESDETFNVTLSSPTGATIAKATAVGTITNDDVTPPTSGGASVGYTVSNEWNSGYNANMTVNAGQTAINGWTVEFDSPAEIVNIWNAQIASHVGTHYVISNMAYNGQVAAGQNTSFGYQANGTSAAGVPTNLKVNGVAVGSPATQPTLSIANMSVAEGNSGTKDATFTVVLSKAATSAVTVGYATSNGTATAGADYTATSGTLTFAPGTTSQTITVKVIGDTTAEADETFNVALSNPSGATIARATAVATITNDDAGTNPTPGISISDASVNEPGTGGIAPGFLHTSGNQIVDSQGKPVQLTGVNWFGAQSSNGVPDGLWTRNYKEMIDQMAGQGFNTIRIPYASALLHTSAAPSGINYYANPDLQGLTRLQVLDKIIDYAGSQGMRVILDHHRSTEGAGTSENGLWYDSKYTEDAWVADWQTLATRYKNNPTVIGFDLHNEPYNGTWGGGGANDWARAAERAGNAVLAINPDLLIIVEGVGSYKGDNYWWGGQLQGVKDRPIVLNVANRVVYSPHDYPNSVWQQPWFQGDNFGAGLPAKFRSEWGYIYEQNIAPIYIGEFGTKLEDPKDAVWLEAITSYLSGDLDNNGTIDIPAGTEDMSWTFWSWNPNSGDTGGILADDWRTINQNKMVYLKPIQYTGGNGTSLATFTVTLAAPSTQTVTVQYATANGTAVAGSDYSAASGTLTFAPGETQKTITVVVKGDTAVEGNENFTVLLSTPVGATLTDASGTGTIIDRVGTA